MKLSEFKGERVIEVTADLLEYIGEIMADEKALELITMAQNKKLSSLEAIIVNLTKSLPYLLRTHKKAICSIFATLEDKKYDEYIKTLSIPKMVVAIKDIREDEEFKQLFISARPVKDEK